MEKNYSEHKSSVLDSSLQSENGICFKNYKNRADIDCDSKTVIINVDSKYDFAFKDFMQCEFGQEFRNNLKVHNDKISEIRKFVSADIDYRKVIIDRQNLHSDSEKIKIDFTDEDMLLCIVNETNLYEISDIINVFYLSNIDFNLSDGIFDFIYADFSTPLNRLINVIESNFDNDFFCFNSHIVDSEEQEEFEQMMRFEMTTEIIKPLLYASVYSGICPPIFDFNKDIVEQIKWYGNYLINKQKEYREIIKFCYDEDYYPDFFLGASPKARCFLYKTLKGLPTESKRTEVMSLDRLPEGRPFRMFDDTFKYDVVNSKTFNKEDYEFAKGSELSIQKMSKIVSLYRYIEEGYVFSNIDEILELEFTKMLKTNIKIKKCKRCGKYFRLKGNYNADYCSRISEGETRNCQDIAAAEKYKEKLANNKALQIYNKYYKRYHARLKVKQIKEPDFYSWKYKTLIMRADCEDGNITPEEYEAWNEEYFPNRTKK